MGGGLNPWPTGSGDFRLVTEEEGGGGRANRNIIAGIKPHLGSQTREVYVGPARGEIKTVVIVYRYYGLCGYCGYCEYRIYVLWTLWIL